MLHDLLHDTNLYESNRRDDDQYRQQLVAKLGEWCGATRSATASSATASSAAASSAAASAASSSSSSTADANAAASKYLELVRQLESYRTHEYQALAALLRVQRLCRVSHATAANVVLRPCAGPGMGCGTTFTRKVAAPVIALYLSLTAEIALYLDQREERSDTTIAQQRGTSTMDPGFLCSGPQIRNVQHYYGRQLTPTLNPRPEPKRAVLPYGRPTLTQTPTFTP